MSESPSRNQYVTLDDYWRVLRHRWWVVVAGIVIGLAASAGYLVMTPKQVTATAAVNLNVISSEPFNTVKSNSGLIDPSTEAQLARSSAVLSAVAKKIKGSASVADIRDNTQVQPLEAATIVRVSFTASTRMRATEGADAIAQGYLDYRTTTAAAKVKTLVDQLDKRRSELRNLLVAANEKIAQSGQGSSSAVQANSDRDMLNIELNSLVGKLNDLESIDTNGGTMVSSAADSQVAVGPSKKVIAGSGGLVGLLLGLVAAFVLNSMDRRVKDARGLAATGGGELLARLGPQPPEIPATGADLDSVRSLRERLLAEVPDGSTIAVFDLSPAKAGTSLIDIGVNLAACLADSGRSRLVLPEYSAEEFSVVEQALELRKTSSRSSIEATRYRSQLVRNLTVVTAPADSGDPAMASHLNQLAGNDDTDYVLTTVVLPATASRSLRLAAGRLARSSILVAKQGHTRVEAVIELVDDLVAVGATVHGSVLVSRNGHVGVVHPLGARSSAANDAPAVHDSSAKDADAVTPS